MKANEIMIGDWVSDSGQFSFKIEDIINKKEVTDNDGFEVKLENIVPIPLTEKMLKLNGFTQMTEGINEFKGINRYKLNNFHALWYGNRKDKSLTAMAFGNIQIDLYYVHELQHALRLCGMEVVADNFKIK